MFEVHTFSVPAGECYKLTVLQHGKIVCNDSVVNPGKYRSQSFISQHLSSYRHSACGWLVMSGSYLTDTVYRDFNELRSCRI